MTDAPVKLAKNLVVGDRAQISLSGQLPQPADVIAVESAVQTIERKVLLITFRRRNGRELQRTFHENAPIRIAKPT